jgi:hypothetical protein
MSSRFDVDSSDSEDEQQGLSDSNQLPTEPPFLVCVCTSSSFTSLASYGYRKHHPPPLLLLLIDRFLAATPNCALTPLSFTPPQPLLKGVLA